jgi:hypothetical protein
MLDSYKGVVSMLLKYDRLLGKVRSVFDLHLERAGPRRSLMRGDRDRHPHHARQRVGNQSGTQSVAGSLKIGQRMRAWLAAAHMLELPNWLAGEMVLTVWTYVATVNFAAAGGLPKRLHFHLLKIVSSIGAPIATNHSISTASLTTAPAGNSREQ